MTTSMNGLQKRIERLEQIPMLQPPARVKIDPSLLTSLERSAWESFRASLPETIDLRRLSDGDLDELERWMLLFQERGGQDGNH